MTKDEKRLTILNEGLSKKPYVDTVGKITIGVGHNLTDKGISDAIVDRLLAEDYTEAEDGVTRHFPWANAFDPVRRAVVVDLVFNLGTTRFSKFVSTIAALKEQQWIQAAAHLKASKWYGQVGLRGPRLTKMLTTGKFPWEP